MKFINTAPKKKAPKEKVIVCEVIGRIDLPDNLEEWNAKHLKHSTETAAFAGMQWGDTRNWHEVRCLPCGEMAFMRTSTSPVEFKSCEPNKRVLKIG